MRPELEAALKLAHQFKEAAPDTRVIFTVHELKRLARNAAELMTLSGALQAGGIQLDAKKLTIKTGKNKDKHPSVASLYRAFAEAEQETTA